MKWLDFMINEAAEFSDCMIKNRGIYNVEDIQLYQTIDKRLATFKPDEHGIFFFPYPIVADGEGLFHLQFASDILSSIFDVLNANGRIEQRRLYVLYPSFDGHIALRCLNTRIREFIYSKEIAEHITYKFII